MQSGKVVTRDQQLKLIRPITKEEVNEAVKGIGDQKAPGCDGFNAFFYKRTWPVIEEEVTAAVIEFFNSGSMYRPINCITITLIPNVKHPSNIKEYRPISCCTVLYKIISKVLTTRMQGIMDHLIDNCQTAFIPGRLIGDNIIIAHELVKGYERKNISPRCMLNIDMQKAYDSLERP